MSSNNDVRSTHKAYDRMLPIWKMCRAAAEGEHAVHEARETYLPRLTQEDEPSYNLRLAMTPFFNATWRTISGLRGMLFRKEPEVEVPPAVEEMLDDIDLAGTTMQGLAQEVSEESLTVGRVGLLVDYPTVPDGLTVLASEQAGYRASIQVYKAETVYNWKTTRINSATVLSQVRLEEEYELETDNEFETKCAKQYRILDLVDGKYRQRLYQSDEFGNPPVQVDGDVFPTLPNGDNLDYIPFVFIGVDTTGPEVEVPPLADLVTTNFHHYQQATSYERGCFFSGLPTMFIYGHDASDEKAGQITIGGKTANSMPNPQTKAEWLEVQSKFEALRTNLTDKKSEMAILGARMLESQKAGVESGDAIARRQVGEQSLLSDMAQTLSQGLERALGWFCTWQGEDGEVEYELNRDFLPANMDAQQLTALVSAWQMGAISGETLFDNMKAGEIVDGDLSYEDEQARINNALIGMTPPSEEAIVATPLPTIDLQPFTDAMLSGLQAIAAAMPVAQEPVAAAMPQPPADMSGIINAITALANKETPAPVINISPAAVNIAPAAITVNMPDQPAAAPITVNNTTGSRTVDVVRNADGSLTGTVKEAPSTM